MARSLPALVAHCRSLLLTAGKRPLAEAEVQGIDSSPKFRVASSQLFAIPNLRPTAERQGAGIVGCDCAPIGIVL